MASDTGSAEARRTAVRDEVIRGCPQPARAGGPDHDHQVADRPRLRGPGELQRVVGGDRAHEEYVAPACALPPGVVREP
jgi:hypothetical protein